MKIAICISSYNRPETLYKCLKEQIYYLPSGIGIETRMFIVDDGSTNKPDLEKIADIVVIPNSPFECEFRPYVENVGVPASKNKCLSQANEWGADNIFLFDDDCYPIADNWWVPYVESKENHLMFEFKLPFKSKNDMQELYRDDKKVAYSHTRGAMLYIKRKVLDVVGGFDTEYGQAMYEHTDWTNRIHNAGLTTYRAMDVPNSDKLLYCLDQDFAVKSSIPDDVRRTQSRRNRALYEQSKTSKKYKEYRDGKI